MKHVFEPVRREPSGAIDQRYYQQRAAAVRGLAVRGLWHYGCSKLTSWCEALRRPGHNR